ncbi:hypothetical protein EHM92_02160 [bacterium]|nr:MAG: hypothetical protein EHM92_02160 [bacterium]
MILPAQRLYALLRTECVLRLRRASTGALFLLLCASAYLLMPDVTQGNAAFIIGQQRVLLTSAATSLATALTGCLLLSLFGFYLVSNAITRDARTGIGPLIATTPVGSASYLAGKFLGNAIYLAIVAAGFMAACMGMHLIRGEGPLEPLTFAVTFGFFFIPLIFTVAAFALLFESVRFLSGRLGDVLYFFVWSFLISIPAIALQQNGNPGWPMFVDATGVGLAIAEVERIAHTTNISIGFSPFNTALPPIVFPGVSWTPEILASRIVASLLALPLLALALAGFRRFDPATGRQTTKRNERAFLHRAGNFLRGRWLVPKERWLTGPPTLLRAVGLDVQLSLALSPFVALAMLVFAIGGSLAPLADLRAGWLPAMFFILVPILAGVSTRDRISNTTGLIFSAPLLRPHYVAWKFLSVSSLSLLVAVVPLVRTMIADPVQLPGFLVGMFLLVSAATALGIFTGTPKTFVVSFLFFLYIVVSSRNEPGLDFAGWNGVATTAVFTVYGGVSLGLMVLAWGWERTRGKR